MGRMVSVARELDMRRTHSVLRVSHSRQMPTIAQQHIQLIGLYFSFVLIRACRDGYDLHTFTTTTRKREGIK